MVAKVVSAQSLSHLLYFLGAVLAVLCLVLAIQYGTGYYNAISIRLLMASVSLSILLIPLLFLAQPAFVATSKPGHFATGPLTLFTVSLLIFEIGLGLQDIYLHYNQNPLFPTFAKGAGWLAILLGATYLLKAPGMNPSGQVFRPDQAKAGRQNESLISAGQSLWLYCVTTLITYRFAALVLLSLILKIVAIFSSYLHIIDVGMMMQESSANLLAGHNPYTMPTAGHRGFVYPPLHLLLPLPFYGMFGDTRFGSIFWEWVGVGCIYSLAKTELSRYPQLVRLAELAILLFLLQPRGLFVIEQAWGEPLIVGMLAASLYFLYYKPASPGADVLFAAMLAIKQYLVFMCFPLFILYDLKWKRYATLALTFSLIVLPFVLWNPVEFYHRNVLHFFQLPIQTNALGLTAYFWERGILIPRWLSPLAAGVVSVGLGFFLRRFGILGYLHTVILTFFCLFIFGQQAFANYYYLISFLQVTAIIFFMVNRFSGLGERPTEHA